MTRKLHFNINANQVRLEIPEQKWVLQQANLVVYDRQTQRMLYLGESEADLKKQLGAEWVEFRRRAAFERLFAPTPAGPVFDFLALDY